MSKDKESNKDKKKQQKKKGKSRKALGKGLKALLDDVENHPSSQPLEDLPESGKSEYAASLGSVISVPLDQIEINPFQPRSDFNEEKLEELTKSVKTHGVIQPITLRKVQRDQYQLIAGERRVRAAKSAGLEEVPAFIRSANDQELLEIALIENIQREDLNAIEIAMNYQRLIDECDLTQEELSQRVGKNRSTIANYLRLLKLPPDIQTSIQNKELSMGHARALVNLKDADQQLYAFKQIKKKNLSVRQVEQLVRDMKKGKKSKSSQNKSPSLPLAYQKVQDKLSSRFETKVKLNANKKGKGEIKIPFYSEEDLNRILDLLGENE